MTTRHGADVTLTDMNYLCCGPDLLCLVSGPFFLMGHVYFVLKDKLCVPSLFGGTTGLMHSSLLNAAQPTQQPM
jgi:hypothetical protein